MSLARNSCHRAFLSCCLLAGAGFATTCPGQVWQDLHAPSSAPMACSADGTILMSLAPDPTMPCNLGLNFSTNSGLSWLGSLDFNGTAVAASADGSRWIVANPECGDLLFSYSSTTGLSAPSPANIRSSLVAISGDGTRMAAAGTYNEPSLGKLGVQVSTNVGASWQSVLTNVGITAIALSADGNTLVAGAESNALFVSTNFGATWVTNIVITNFSGPWSGVACSANGGTIVATSAEGPFAMSNDTGKNWGTLKGGNLQSIAVSADGLLGLGVDEMVSAYYWTNGSTFWNSSLLGFWLGSVLNTSVAMSADGSRLYAGVQSHGLYSIQVTPPAPSLTLKGDLNRLTLRWPFPGNNLLLQSSTNPATNFWLNLPATPQLDPSTVQNQLDVPISAQPTFYRLAGYPPLTGTFRDLDFESGTLVPTNGSYPVSVALSAAFPGWVVYLGSNKVDVAGYNAYPLDSAAISLETNTDLTMDGKYWAGLFAGDDAAQNPPKVSASLAQTGFIPPSARSLLFKAQWFNSGQPAPIITMNSQALAITPLGGNLFGADISSYAGTTAELRFTVLPAQPPLQPINGLFLDSISFSPQTVP